MASKKVSSDIVYQELYQEMRRYRDYELSVSTWYTAILLAILGGVFTAKYGDLGLAQLANECVIKFIAAFIVLIVGGSGLYSIWFSYRRYKHISEYIFNKKLNLEPSWKSIYTPEKVFLKPRHLIMTTQIILIVLTILVIILPG